MAGFSSLCINSFLANLVFQSAKELRLQEVFYNQLSEVNGPLLLVFYSLEALDPYSYAQGDGIQGVNTKSYQKR